ncbi:MAG: methionyl-tRNA formyltransferase [Dehalococcoidales bacterium]|nr:methionyl-tRNA formyltransferase [Dehalococcoidales bacterium]
MRVVFMGTPQFAVPPLEHLLFNGYQVVAVYTQPDRAAGRGRLLAASPVKRVAIDWGLPVVQPASFKKTEVVAELASFKPDVIVVAAFGQILSQSVLDIPVYGCFNLHPSLLPRFRGASPVAAAILAGDQFTGVSVMQMEAGLDSGPVLVQARVPVFSQDTTGSLTAKLSLIAAHLLLETLPRWLKGELTPRPQEEAEATYCPTISNKESKIDWHLPAVAIWRQVRAWQPWPGCYTEWRGKRLKIIESLPLPGESAPEAGRVVALNKEGAVFGIGSGEGILGVLKVQLEGKRVMTAAEFLRGQPQFIGAVLPSG